MAGPWEKYQSTESGPWSKYAAPQVAPAPEAPLDPTADMSTVQKGLAGVGKAFVDVGRGTGQILRNVLPERASDAIGLPTQADIDEAKRLDAPLMNTTAGLVGNIAGNVAIAAPTAFLPGANTVAGAALYSGAQGAVQPVATGESRLTNTALAAGAGAAGQKAGQMIGSRVGKAMDARALASAQNAPRDAILATSKEAGYVVPPSSVNPSAINQALEGLSGKIKTGQLASQKNQGVTNGLVRKALGLSDDAPINREALGQIRQQAGQAYEAVRGAGRVQTDAEFVKALDDITAKYRGAAQDFPELADDAVLKMAEGLRKPEFDASSGIDMISMLRDRADKAYRAGDKALGAAHKRAANALEETIDRHLDRIKAPGDMIVEFRNARQAIAKTYSVESALNDATGNVDARKLAAQLKKGKPLSGSLREAAQFAQQFPKAAQEVTESMPALSPLDYGTAAITAGATGSPLGLIGLVGRPGVRAGVLSRPYQAGMVNPQYGTNALARIAAQNPRATNLLSRSLPVAVANSRE